MHRIHTFHSHLACTPPIPISHSHLLFTPPIHTSHSHLPFKPSVHTSHSHLPFTPPIHTFRSHLPFTPPIHTSYSQGDALLLLFGVGFHDDHPAGTLLNLLCIAFTPQIHTSHSHLPLTPPIHRRFIFKEHTSTHAQGTDPRLALET